MKTTHWQGLIWKTIYLIIAAAAQADINDKMRAILIDWLVEVHLKFKVQTRSQLLREQKLHMLPHPTPDALLCPGMHAVVTLQQMPLRAADLCHRCCRSSCRRRSSLPRI